MLCKTTIHEIYTYEERKGLYNRFFYILGKYLLYLVKSFFFSRERGTKKIFLFLFEILSHTNLTGKLNIISWFNILNEDLEKNQIIFFKNLRTAIPFLLLQIENESVVLFLKQSVKSMISSINNPKLVIKVSKLIPVLYFHCGKLKNTISNSIYNSFFNYLNEQSINIIRALFPIIQNREHSSKYLLTFFDYLILSFELFLSKSSKELLKKTYTQYMIDNLQNELAFHGVYPLLQYEDIWKFAYTSLISFNNKISNEIKPYCLYSDERIKHLSVKEIDNSKREFIFFLNLYLILIKIIWSFIKNKYIYLSMQYQIA